MDITPLDLNKITNSIKKGIEALAPFTKTPGSGTTRLPFTIEARNAVNEIKVMMSEAGLSVHEDAAGNVIGVLEGAESALPAIVTGSHYDTVVNGGNFDGLAGVITGIEIAKILKEKGMKLKRNYIVIAFCDEEGLRFNTGYFGSKSWLGQIDQNYLHTFKDKDDISVYEAMKEYGLTPEELPSAKWDISKVKAFIEMHIEQGPVLDKEKIEIGLVECIVGMQRYIVTVKGRADHAGTTPMDLRMDAVEAAAKVIAKIPDWAREKSDGTVGTTGYMKVLPGGMNIVAKEVQFSIDIRSRNKANLDNIMTNIRAELEKVCAECRTSYSIEEKLIIEPVDLNKDMLNHLEDSCKKFGYSYKRMVSGAGHDSLAIGPVIDTVMVFSPSKEGRSHCPVEWTDYGYISKAVTVILDLIVKMQ